MIQDQLRKRPASVSAAATKPEFVEDPTLRMLKEAEESAETDKKSLNVALGLLLKHRGGPGFGHGRLDGHELELLETSLRKASSIMARETQEMIA
jgi:hypothetical protein